VRLADAYRALGRLDDSAAVLRRGLAERPGHLAGRVLKARLLLDVGELEACGRELGAIDALMPGHWAALQLALDLARASADGDAEQAAVDRMLTLLPGEPELTRHLDTLESAEARPTMGPRPKASTPRSETVPSSPHPSPQPALRSAARESSDLPYRDDPFVNGTMAELLAAQGDVAGAQAMLAQLVRRDPAREQYRRRYLELGGPGADLAPAPEAAQEVSAAALETALRTLVGEL